jgi:hypothetical protein
MALHARALATVEQLESRDWFTQLGTINGITQPDKIILVASWDEAMTYCTSEIWDDVILEAQNQYCSRLFEHSPARFRHWNEVVALVEPVGFDLVDRKIATVLKDNNLPNGFVGCVRSDIVGLLLEAEYADVIAPGFFAANGYWYATGHFPCGWVGDFQGALPPYGRLVIY